ncbi:MAG: hypothetical protein FD130_1097 [Halothiobacillaceae bacterium]|nr:MAG: hypothetical protein FD130_1097 [Halothiobacillaceae bacterium]
MEQLITRTLESLFFPPGVFILLLVMALLLMRWRKVAGQCLLWATVAIVYLMTTPLVAQRLLSLLERSPALTTEQIQKSGAQVIVVLAGGRYRNAPEYGGDTVGESTLVRIRYGAWLHHKTGLPLLVSGGHVFDRGGDSLTRYIPTRFWLPKGLPPSIW